MKDTFHGFTAVWHGPVREWSVWIAARSRVHASICAVVTFAVLERQADRQASTG